MNIQNNISLAPYTTFKIGGPAKHFVEIENVNDVSLAVNFAKANSLSTLILGGGANMLVNDNGFDGLVIHLKNKGIEKIDETDMDIIFKIAAGEIWDDVVSYFVKNNWWGVENLSHIPGLVGSLPIQNVGAYGQQTSEILQTVDAYDTKTDSFVVLSNQDCGFSYRKSIFNSTEKGRYVVLFVTLKLSKIPKPNIKYIDVGKYFVERNIQNPTIEQIRDAIISIRDKKYPFPTVSIGGNAGSFFKNLNLNQSEYDTLKQNIEKNFSPEVVDRLTKIKDKFPQPTGIKIPTAFLIEICGLKGASVGGAKINENQPLVIINSTGTATASDVLELFNKVKNEALRETGMTLVNEPELIGF